LISSSPEAQTANKNPLAQKREKPYPNQPMKKTTKFIIAAGIAAALMSAAAIIKNRLRTKEAKPPTTLSTTTIPKIKPQPKTQKPENAPAQEPTPENQNQAKQTPDTRPNIVETDRQKPGSKTIPPEPTADKPAPAAAPAPGTQNNPNTFGAPNPNPRKPTQRRADHIAMETGTEAMIKALTARLNSPAAAARLFENNTAIIIICDKNQKITHTKTTQSLQTLLQTNPINPETAKTLKNPGERAGIIILHSRNWNVEKPSIQEIQLAKSLKHKLAFQGALLWDIILINPDTSEHFSFFKEKLLPPTPPDSATNSEPEA
jgi:hypothetical protein